jgi:hypothetical protein
MTTKIKLPNVTLICLTGIDFKTKEHKEAIKKSCEGIEFGVVKIVQQSNIIDIDSWNKAVIYDLWKYVDTEFALFIHQDGYVIHPELWNNSWLDYDFIGAPWPLPTDNYSYRDEVGELVRVGNSVSLRSRTLLYMPIALDLEWRPFFGNTNEDGFLCCHHRKTLEANGIKFAPLDVAVHFSKEHEIPENVGLETFAFHSLV